MPALLIPSLFIYCIVNAITPGPANLCSLAAAMKYGKTIALRQWKGIFLGHSLVAFMASLLVWSFGSLAKSYIHFLTWAGAAYLLWMAFHLLKSSISSAHTKSRCNFFTGLFIQLTNPKIYVTCITALISYSLPYAESYLDLFRIAIFLPLAGPLANLLWLISGAKLKDFFAAHQKPLNALMAASLVYCAGSIVCM